jgi:hypothetical protein
MIALMIASAVAKPFKRLLVCWSDVEERPPRSEVKIRPI